MHHPKLPASSRIRGHLGRNVQGWRERIDGLTWGPWPIRGDFVVGVTPQVRATGESQTPAIYTLSNSGSSKINTNKGIIRRDIARMDGKGVASYSARKKKAQILLSSRQFRGGLGYCGADLGHYPTPLLTLPWLSTRA